MASTLGGNPVSCAAANAALTGIRRIQALAPAAAKKRKR
jgi:acetylornithine/succinyldiaminopimelate/putrescine aminotransferase